MEWQDIASAPKDGTPVLVFSAQGQWNDDWNYYEGRFEPAQGVMWADERGYWHGRYPPIPPVDNPTHWMPLPAPPANPGPSTSIEDRL